jgi:hypothetical protein
MKHTPIQDPKHIGCACCPGPGRELRKDKMLDVGFGETVLTIEFDSDRKETVEYVGGIDWDNFPTVADWEKEHGHKFTNAECVTIYFNTPLHDETYEFNSEDGKWYLIKQGMGFA